MNEIRGARKKNVMKIIQSLVKQGGCTKNELVFYTGLSLSTIDSLLEEMLKSNRVIRQAIENQQVEDQVCLIR